LKLIIAGGGTGGHLFPAVALGEEMVRERPDSEVLYVGTRYGFEAKWLPKTPYRYELYDVHGLLGGRGAMARVKSIAELARAVVLARATLRRFGADLVVLAGGYASAPMGLAAIFSRTPLVLMEQNTTPGFSNRMLWRFAKKICVAFEESVAHFSPGKAVVTGIPVRYQPRADHKPRSDSPIQILVLGASTGAHRLNMGVLKAFEIWRNSVINLEVVHQTGEADEEMVRAEYRNLPLKAEVTAFIDDVPAALFRSDLVIARSGGGTVTDVALAARPAIFVPYPFHRDRQQFHNARVIERAGGAIIINDDDNLGANLAREIPRLIFNRELLREMGDKAHAAVPSDAAQKIARVCFDTAARGGISA
jgi:UDP-N-acetylglucosamine--N-acetylmuramyl-(pentapeptide) pyrophosphoryl-undecaprenol N-acetylglucosamine transferase